MRRQREKEKRRTEVRRLEPEIGAGLFLAALFGGLFCGGFSLGLFAAIPAVAAYNYYNNRVGRLTVRLEGFSEEFLNILQRQHARS